MKPVCSLHLQPLVPYPEIIAFMFCGICLLALTQVPVKVLGGIALLLSAFLVLIVAIAAVMHFFRHIGIALPLERNVR